MGSWGSFDTRVGNLEYGGLSGDLDYYVTESSGHASEYVPNSSV